MARSLRSQLIRLASEKPEFRQFLLPLLRKASGWSTSRLISALRKYEGTLDVYLESKGSLRAVVDTETDEDGDDEDVLLETEPLDDIPLEAKDLIDDLNQYEDDFHVFSPDLIDLKGLEIRPHPRNGPGEKCIVLRA